MFRVHLHERHRYISQKHFIMQVLPTSDREYCMKFSPANQHIQKRARVHETHRKVERSAAEGGGRKACRFFLPMMVHERQSSDCVWLQKINRKWKFNWVLHRRRNDNVSDARALIPSNLAAKALTIHNSMYSDPPEIIPALRH